MKRSKSIGNVSRLTIIDNIDTTSVCSSIKQETSNSSNIIPKRLVFLFIYFSILL